MANDNRDVPDKPMYEDVTWLADVQRSLRQEIDHFAQTYPAAVKLDDTGRLRVLPLAPVREREIKEP